MSPDRVRLANEYDKIKHSIEQKQTELSQQYSLNPQPQSQSMTRQSLMRSAAHESQSLDASNSIFKSS